MQGLTDDQMREIAEARDGSAATRRPTADGLERILFQPIPVLDRGFVRVVDYMGDDAAVVQGARVSYGRGTRAVQSDRGLIRYLMRHRHTTPFELAEIKLHVRAPLGAGARVLRAGGGRRRRAVGLQPPGARRGDG